MFTYYTVAPYDVMITANFDGDVEARPAVVEYGDNLTLDCTASGSSDNIFYWYKDSYSNFYQRNNALNINTVNATDGGRYICSVSNIFGSNDTDITIYGMSSI